MNPRRSNAFIRPAIILVAIVRAIAALGADAEMWQAGPLFQEFRLTLENGRQKEAYINFDDKTPKEGLKKLGFIE